MLSSPKIEFSDEKTANNYSLPFNRCTAPGADVARHAPSFPYYC